MPIFIVPSCIKSNIGKISVDDRYQQTLRTFETIRERVGNDAAIVFVDSSIGGLEENRKQEIVSKVNYFLDFSGDPTAQELNKQGLKSFGESYLLGRGILFVKETFDLSLTPNARMFKLGGRCELLESFTMKDYHSGVDGKFVFKKRLESWMPKDMQNRLAATHILETRLYSWSFSLVDEYLHVLDSNVALIRQGLDTEHSHFKNIPKDKLVEFDKLHVRCFVAAGAYYIED